MNAIIYTTNTGSTEHYAKLLAHETGLPAYSLAEAKKKVYPRTEVIYMGWIMASSVKGYAEAAKRYHVCAVCSVGMGADGNADRCGAKKESHPCEYPYFYIARQLRCCKAPRPIPSKDGNHGQDGWQGSCQQA